MSAIIAKTLVKSDPNVCSKSYVAYLMAREINLFTQMMKNWKCLKIRQNG